MFILLELVSVASLRYSWCWLLVTLIHKGLLWLLVWFYWYRNVSWRLNSLSWFWTVQLHLLKWVQSNTSILPLHYLSFSVRLRKIRTLCHEYILPILLILAVCYCDIFPKYVVVVLEDLFLLDLLAILVVLAQVTVLRQHRLQLFPTPDKQVSHRPRNNVFKLTSCLQLSRYIWRLFILIIFSVRILVCWLLVLSVTIHISR